MIVVDAPGERYWQRWRGPSGQGLAIDGARIYAYGPDGGEPLWHCSGNLSEVTPTPVADDGLLFCASGRAGLALVDGNCYIRTRTHLYRIGAN